MTNLSIFDKPQQAQKTPKPLQMQDLWGHSREAWLLECRSIAKQLLRNTETVTVEDVMTLCPKPTWLHQNTCGAIFDNQFKPVDFVKAKHKAAKGRWIRSWRLK